MAKFVVFLRAVNVGGRQLRMAQARTVLSDHGFTDVESHIQTGNFLVSTSMRSAARVEAAVAAALSGHAGFDIVAIVRTPVELANLVATVDAMDPAVAGETSRYISFCTATPSAAAATELAAQGGGGERAVVIGKDVLMEFAVPYHLAKLTGVRVERILGVPGTARNMTVVRALAQKWSS